ncbi:YihY/virulence factor BrkB family protein [Gloeocapsopsis dulcis]|uniref:Ribonuclease BN n=1 Tax=Gloeocapsopsis dulcis AAB1 = 1H9 TaxID=1433147 RepID=A0A6N8G1G4_9CHRO|nr:YihY/virulence factor BrkB family protein [Gloeocapsopsis dulcis]MUL39248.1 ribonuclease BN [Gloeocapsopsis dulcis AAB1 = 1H9]WNN90866.1 YihY/virulence factor BrkB family protein [Gloeocapsopsis dulcis]
MKYLRNLWRLLKETISEWQFNQVSLLASSLAYYTVFSLVPLMILVIMMVGAIYGEAIAKQQLVNQIQGIVGIESAQVIATAIANMRQDATEGTFQLIFNLAFFAFGASGVFAQIQNALDKIWEVKPEPGRHMTHFLRKRLLSFAMVLVIAFLLLVSFLANAVLASIVDVLNDLTPGRGYWWQILSFLVSFSMITVLFAAMYTVLPDAKVRWRDALVGSMFTTILFMLGQYFFGLFLGQTNFASAYGVAGSFLIIITWIYYAAHILFLGAEFTKVYAKQHGSPIVPEEYAIPISEDVPQAKQKRSPGLLTNFRRQCMRTWHSLIGRR